MSNDALLKLIKQKKELILVLVSETLEQSVLDKNRDIATIKKLEIVAHEDISHRRLQERPLNGFTLTIKEKVRGDRIFFVLNRTEMYDLDFRLKDADMAIDWERYEQNNKTVYIKLVDRHTKRTQERTTLDNMNRRHILPEYENLDKPKNRKKND